LASISLEPVNRVVAVAPEPATEDRQGRLDDVAEDATEACLVLLVGGVGSLVTNGLLTKFGS
jgi:hypothetical protein